MVTNLEVSEKELEVIKNSLSLLQLMLAKYNTENPTVNSLLIRLEEENKSQ